MSLKLKRQVSTGVVNKEGIIFIKNTWDLPFGKGETIGTEKGSVLPRTGGKEGLGTKGFDETSLGDGKSDLEESISSDFRWEIC